MIKVYIAGPMTGHDDLNYPAFHSMSERLRAMGFYPVSPAELNPVETPYREAMVRDILALVECQHIVMLDGWEKSKGATLEHHIATVLEIERIEIETVTTRAPSPD